MKLPNYSKMSLSSFEPVHNTLYEIDYGTNDLGGNNNILKQYNLSENNCKYILTSNKLELFFHLDEKLNISNLRKHFIEDVKKITISLHNVSSKIIKVFEIRITPFITMCDFEIIQDWDSDKLTQIKIILNKIKLVEK